MIPLNTKNNTELNRGFLEEKDRKEWERLNAKYGAKQEKKIDKKAGGKEDDKESVRSGSSETSKISKATTKSFGNALKGDPGSIFPINDLTFKVLGEWVGKNRKV